MSFKEPFRVKHLVWGARATATTKLKENRPMITKLKDLSQMTLTVEEVQPIADKFGKGEGMKQEAFQDLVNLSVGKLLPFTEEKKSGTKLLTGAMKNLAILMESSLLELLGLGSSYCAPARQLAKATIEGGSPTLLFVVNHLTAMGKPKLGDLVGPQFAPSRLIISMKNLRLDPEKSLFSLNENKDTLFIKDRQGNLHRFGSQSIEGIKDCLRLNVPDAETLDILNTLVGMFTAEGEKEKPGALGREVTKLIKAATTDPENPDQFALDIAERLLEIRDEVRTAAIRKNREERAANEARQDMERAQKRLAKQQDLGASRERVGASVATTNGDDASDE